MADFMQDVAIELLSYADTIKESKNQGDDQKIGKTISKDETRLRNLALKRRNNRLVFNAPDSLRLRLSVQGHEPKQQPLYIALCGQNAGGWM